MQWTKPRGSSNFGLTFAPAENGDLCVHKIDYRSPADSKGCFFIGQRVRTINGSPLTPKKAHARISKASAGTTLTFYAELPLPVAEAAQALPVASAASTASDLAFSTPTRPATDASSGDSNVAPAAEPTGSPPGQVGLTTPTEHSERCDINARKFLTTEQTLLLDRALCSAVFYATWDQDFNLPRIALKPTAAAGDIPFAKELNGCLLVRVDGDPVPDLKALEVALRGADQTSRDDPVAVRVARVVRRLKPSEAKMNK